MRCSFILKIYDKKRINPGKMSRLNEEEKMVARMKSDKDN